MDAIKAYPMVIDGELVRGKPALDVIDPATGEVFARAVNCSRAQLDVAVAAARRAYPAWRARTPAERASLLEAVAQTIEAHREDLAELLTREQGKPLDNARGEIGLGAIKCRDVGRLNLPDRIVEVDGRKVRIVHTPLGVVGAIAPWNFPISLAFQKVAAALYTGNTVVLKPSPFTPLTTLRIGDLCREVLPPGVLNVVSGGDRLGPWITSHPDIDKISFTGSVATGRRVMQSAAGTLKRVTLELGGNDATVVLPDVDLETVVQKVFWAAFFNAGQICIAAKRIYVHKDIREAFVERFVAFGRTVRVGPGLQAGSQVGPVQNKIQLDRVAAFAADSVRSGHRVIQLTDLDDGPGYFFPLTVVDRPPDQAQIVQDEQFGPIVPILEFEDDADLVQRVNATAYGLGVSIWCADLERATRLGEQIDVGTVWINEERRISPLLPFGGHKQSGMGPEGGVEGLMQYTDAKVITVVA